MMKRALILSIIIAGCGGCGGDGEALNASEERDEVTREEVECLLECGTCEDWPTVAGILQTIRMTSLEGSSLVEVNGCSGVAIDEHTILTAGHCMDNLEWDLDRLRIIPGSVFREPVCDEQKTPVDVRPVGGDIAQITVSEPLRWWTPTCGDMSITNTEITVEGYPVNYDGNLVPQTMRTIASSETKIFGDWGPGASGGPAYAGNCVTGIMVRADGVIIEIERTR